MQRSPLVTGIAAVILLVAAFVALLGLGSALGLIDITFGLPDRLTYTPCAVLQPLPETVTACPPAAGALSADGARAA
ncbi:hypothetical protein [Actinoplanes rectilineatus]|uniref:hypothetical protein n=1 Tax=Actinoplanes rectilineatus TaxID=113571 RepID=UPI0005F2DA9D|nr:hypothetical protein [Actinoplanes rectilineatus]